MAKMSKAQRIAILDFHNGVTSKRHTMLASARTVDVLVREGWAKRPEEMTRRLVQQFPLSVRRMAYVTTAGLLAAGVDMDAIHEDAKRDDVVREARAIVPEPKRLLPEGAPVVVLRGELDRMHETFVAQAALDEAYREDRNRGNIEMAKRAAVRLNREFAANADALSAELAREV